MRTTEEIQTRLAALGYEPGPIDGIRGRRTSAAIKSFQHDHGLAADGVVGPLTRARLFAGTAQAPKAGEEGRPDLPWLEEAQRLRGTQETPGPGSNPKILDWADDLDIAYGSDAIPWCGLLAGHCFGATLPDESLPAGLLLARNWRRFGRPCEPSVGAALVFWRGSREGTSGHVAFYVGEDARSYYVLGGNQSNAVNVARIARDRLLDARWPLTALYGERRVVSLEPGANAFSINEA